MSRAKKKYKKARSCNTDCKGILKNKILKQRDLKRILEEQE